MAYLLNEIFSSVMGYRITCLLFWNNVYISEWVFFFFFLKLWRNWVMTRVYASFGWDVLTLMFYTSTPRNLSVPLNKSMVHSYKANTTGTPKRVRTSVYRINFSTNSSLKSCNKSTLIHFKWSPNESFNLDYLIYKCVSNLFKIMFTTWIFSGI